MRVRVLAAGVAYPNPLTREGVHPEKPLLRFRPRWDLIGAVDRLGKGISGIEPGQIIAALPISGAYRVTGSDSGAQPRQMAPTARDRFVHVRLAGGDLPEMPLGHRPIAQTADDRRIDVSSLSLAASRMPDLNRPHSKLSSGVETAQKEERRCQNVVCPNHS